MQRCRVLVLENPVATFGSEVLVAVFPRPISVMLVRFDAAEERLNPLFQVVYRAHPEPPTFLRTKLAPADRLLSSVDCRKQVLVP
jgi:hypothetical protein